jgi:hypothetical protein
LKVGTYRSAACHPNHEFPILKDKKKKIKKKTSVKKSNKKKLFLPKLAPQGVLYAALYGTYRKQ